MPTVWKPMKGAEKYYLLSETGGRIKGLQRNRELKPKNVGGYLGISLNYDGKRVEKRMAIILAETFKPNPKGHTSVIHIDGDTTNNDVSNLEWATVSEKRSQTGGSNTGKAVHQLDLSGKYIAEFPSVREAALATNTNAGSISNVCLGRIRPKTAGGCLWKFVETKTTVSEEDWDPSAKPIPGFNRYEAAQCGKIYDTVTCSEVSPRTTSEGYLAVNLTTGDGSKQYHVQRLVALAHVPNPNNYKMLRMKDGDRSNVHMDNLAWRAPSVLTTLTQFKKIELEWNKRPVSLFKISYKEIDGKKTRLLWYIRDYKNMSTGERNLKIEFRKKLIKANDNGIGYVIVGKYMFTR